MKHYVYKLEDKKTGEFYYGSRTCKCKIEEDKYSGSMKTWKPNKDNLIKTIIKSNFRKRETALKYEAKIINENINNPLNRNYHIPTIGFSTQGKCLSNQERDKYSNVTKKWVSKLSEAEKKEKFGSPGELNPMYGVKRSDEWKQKQRKRMEKYYKTHPYSNEGKTFNNEWRKNISKSRIENGIAKGSNNGNSLGNILITDLHGNKTKYDTIMVASQILKVSRQSLSTHCKNKTSYQRGKYKGWIFEIIK